MLLFCIILMAYAVIKVFFANLKRGGHLCSFKLQWAVLYMFSVPRGYTDGFIQWCKQIIGLCLTAFLQSTILIAGLMVFQGPCPPWPRPDAVRWRRSPHRRSLWPGLPPQVSQYHVCGLYRPKPQISTTRTIVQAVAK